MGIDFYIGTTGVGKTTLAEMHAAQSSAARGVPVLMVDPEGVLSLDGAAVFTPPDKPFRKSEREAFAKEEDYVFDTLIQHVWTKGQHAIYRVRDEDDAERLFAMVKKGGNLELVVDEASYWARGQSALPSLLSLCRANRLSGVNLYFTTQYPGDLNPLVWNVKRKVFLFNCAGDDALDRLRSELRLSDETLAALPALPPGQFLEWTGATGAAAGGSVEDEGPNPHPDELEAERKYDEEQPEES